MSQSIFDQSNLIPVQIMTSSMQVRTVHVPTDMHLNDFVRLWLPEFDQQNIHHRIYYNRIYTDFNKTHLIKLKANDFVSHGLLRGSGPVACQAAFEIAYKNLYLDAKHATYEGHGVRWAYLEILRLRELLVRELLEKETP